MPSFGSRLRYERERRQIALKSIAESTKISVALLEGLERAQAQGLWQADPDSEARRLRLLPQSPPRAWDELMHDPVYQHALERLP